MNVTKISISLDFDVFERIEQLRGSRTQYRSKFINGVLRQVLGLHGNKISSELDEKKIIIAPVPNANPELAQTSNPVKGCAST